MKAFGVGLVSEGEVSAAKEIESIAVVAEDDKEPSKEVPALEETTVVIKTEQDPKDDVLALDEATVTEEPSKIESMPKNGATSETLPTAEVPA